jgi:hypothetical protein
MERIGGNANDYGGRVEGDFEAISTAYKTL